MIQPIFPSAVSPLTRSACFRRRGSSSYARHRTLLGCVHYLYLTQVSGYSADSIREVIDSGLSFVTVPVEMDRLRCRVEQLPDNLYRVQYDGCNTVFSSNGLFAADTTTIFDEAAIPAFRKSIVDQFTRTNRLPTPYISTFSEREHAENWALKMGTNAKLLRLSTALWDDPYIFKLSTLVEMLPVMIPDAASQHIKGAYLCLHSVPSEAIVEVMDREDIKISMAVAIPLAQSLLYLLIARLEIESRGDQEYYLPYDPDDSEDEAIENNFNDDLMKMLEGDWEIF